MFIQGNILGSNTSACVSVRELSYEQEYEIVLRPCNYKLPSICQKKDGKDLNIVNLFSNFR